MVKGDHWHHRGLRGLRIGKARRGHHRGLRGLRIGKARRGPESSPSTASGNVEAGHVVFGRPNQSPADLGWRRGGFWWERRLGAGDGAPSVTVSRSLHRLAPSTWDCHRALRGGRLRGGKALSPLAGWTPPTARTSSLTAGAVGTVARLAASTGTARAAQLSTARNLFGHHVHLLFGGQPAGAVPDVPTVRSRCPEQTNVEGLQLPFESCQLRDPSPRLGQLVHDQMPKTIAHGSDICARAAYELAHLADGEAQSLRPLDEPEPVDRRLTVDPVTAGAPVGRLHQPRPFVVAKSRGGDAHHARELADSHLVLRHGPDATPSTALQGQGRRVPFPDQWPVCAPWPNSTTAVSALYDRDQSTSPTQ